MTSKEIYQNIDARLTHLEDATLDNREILIKLIQQGNKIVKFLKDFEIESVDEYMDYPVPVGLNNERDSKFRAMKDLIDDYLGKHKDKLTPGIVGKS